MRAFGRGPRRLFTRRWGLYVGGVLALPFDAAAGFTPASLRAGSATELYAQTGNLPQVQWHLRHGGLENLHNYIQELPLALARAALTPAQTARVARFARVSELLRRLAVAGHGPPTVVASRTLRRTANRRPR